LIHMKRYAWSDISKSIIDTYEEIRLVGHLKKHYRYI